MATLNYAITTSGGVRAVDPETGAEVATCPATGTIVVQLLRPALRERLQAALEGYSIQR